MRNYMGKLAIPLFLGTLAFPLKSSGSCGPNDWPEPDTLRTPAYRLPADKGMDYKMGSYRFAALVSRKGDTWWSYARDYLGDGSRWEELRNENLDVMGVRQGSDFLPAGEMITIPLGGESYDFPPVEIISAPADSSDAPVFRKIHDVYR